MTLIVASLFLPYTVEFELEDPSSVEELAATLPIALPKQRSSSINASSTKLPTGSILHQQPKFEYKTNNNSVEEFFFSQQGSPQLQHPGLSRAQSHNAQTTSALNTTQATGSLAHYANMARSTPGLSTASPEQQQVGFEDFSRPMRRTGSSTSFIPKSRLNSPPPLSVTEAITKKKKALETTVLSVKRIPATSNLKFTIDDEDGDNDDDFDETATAGSATKYADIDDGYDSNSHYHIPKYGGDDVKRTRLLNKEEKSDIFEKSPLNVVEFGKGNGALKNAIKSSLEDGIVDDYVWLGTVGIPTDELTEKTKEKITNKLKKEYNCESVLPSDFTFQGHYKNFCKQILWPTLHYQIPDNPNSKAFEDHSWEYYRELNQQFADKIVEIYKDGDTIWVHDYHLLLVPQMVRSKLPDAKIGFFLHVSFPSSEVFRCFAQRESLLKGMLGSNAISFQTDEYVRHFLQTCNKLLLADISDNELRYKGQTVKVCSQPVGIDAGKLNKQIQSDAVLNWRAMIRERWHGKRLIVGRDKYDRIRGVKQKLLAYETFLKANPEYIEDTVLIQICLKSNSVDSVLESEIMSIVDRINGLSQNISNIQPVVFLHQDIEFVQYLALIAEADTFVVSSMREGMNLTCHEFIVATTEKKSPLILSEFTGSAAVFTKGALLINPWDTKQMSACYLKALTMSEDEKAKNWQQLYTVVSHQDCDYWVQTTLQFIYNSWSYQKEKAAYFTLDVPEFTDAYKNASTKLFIFLLSHPPSERMIRILSDLSLNNDVYILSTYGTIPLERLYGRVPRLGLIAESGSFIKLKNSSDWACLGDDDVSSWMETTNTVALSFAERLPGSYVECGKASLKFHTEQVQDRERKAASIGDLIAHVNNIDQNIHATLVENTVYVQQTDVTLNAIKKLLTCITKTGSLGDDLRHLNTPPSTPVGANNGEPFVPKPLDFLCIGGDVNNLFEPILEHANLLGSEGDIKNVFTIAFGGSVSNAKEHVEGLNELFTIVKDIIS